MSFIPVTCAFGRQVSVQLVEASDHIMGSFDEKLIDYTTGLLKNRKVSCTPPFLSLGASYVLCPVRP